MVFCSICGIDLGESDDDPEFHTVSALAGPFYSGEVRASQHAKPAVKYLNSTGSRISALNDTIIVGTPLPWQPIRLTNLLTQTVRSALVLFAGQDA